MRLLLGLLRRGLALGFQVKLGLVWGKFFPAGLSSSSVSAFRAAIVRAVWSSKMPLANAPALLNLPDGPVGVDPAFLSTSKSVRRAVKLWDISGDGKFWKVQKDIRGLGVILI